MSSDGHESEHRVQIKAHQRRRLCARLEIAFPQNGHCDKRRKQGAATMIRERIGQACGINQTKPATVSRRRTSGVTNCKTAFGNCLRRYAACARSAKSEVRRLCRYRSLSLGSFAQEREPQPGLELTPEPDHAADGSPTREPKPPRRKCARAAQRAELLAREAKARKDIKETSKENGFEYGERRGRENSRETPASHSGSATFLQ